MSATDKLETTVAEWLRLVPHLPSTAQKWLADNVWWLAIISVVASASGILIDILSLMSYLNIYGPINGLYTTQYIGGVIIVSLASVVFSLVTTFLTILAISHLKVLRKKGWNLLFLILIVNAISAIVVAALSTIINQSLLGFIVGVIVGGLVVAIEAYFLFEIRSYFIVKAKPMLEDITIK
jgi:hypothetical protein